MSSNHVVFLGIDAGTSSVKAGFVDENGKGLICASAPYETHYGSGNFVTQNAADWWNAATLAVQTIAKQEPELAKRVVSIGISCQTPTLFGIDSQGNPVGEGAIWMDRRAEKLCREKLSGHREYFRSSAMNRIDPYYMSSELLWQIENNPSTYEKTETFLQINGWLNYRLTGEKSMDISNANLTQLLNVHTLSYDQGIFDRLGADIRKMPPLVSCETELGRITENAAELWGISKNATVCAGAVDGTSVAYGLGLNEPGDIFEMSGTSSGIGVVLDHPVYSEKLCLMKHVLQDLWFLKGSTSYSGGSLTWLKERIDHNQSQDAFSEYDALSEQSVPGAHGLVFLPYLNGERAPLWNSNLRGVLLGFSPMTEKADIVRAIMEGTGYALRTILDEFPKDAFRKKEILGTGGGYKSRIWSQIKADILEMPIRVKTSDFDAAVLGAAYLAMKSAGFPYPETDEDSFAIIYEPNPVSGDIYREQYQKFKKTYEATKDLFE